MAGITTSLAMVPEVVAFALLAHVNPLVGLYAAFIVGLISAAFGGRPGLISGGAGSLAVVSASLVLSHGVQYLFACIILMGFLQISFGLARLGKLIKFVTPPVMTGFVNGLALLIFTAQFHQFKIDGKWMQEQELLIMALLIGLTVLVTIISPKIIKFLPGSLLGIVAATLLVKFFDIKTKLVGDLSQISGALPTFSFPNVPISWETFFIIAPYSVILAAIGLIETLLTANLVDEFVTNHHPTHSTHPNKESVAQGVGNVLTGFFGGMGGCAMIGQTVINLEAGGFLRLAGIIQSMSILAYILFAGFIIEAIPIAALIGVMFVVCYHTFDWQSLRPNQQSIDNLLIMASVTVLTFITNLAYSVIIGIALSQFILYYKKTSNE